MLGAHTYDAMMAIMKRVSRDVRILAREIERTNPKELLVDLHKYQLSRLGDLKEWRDRLLRYGAKLADPSLDVPWSDDYDLPMPDHPVILTVPDSIVAEFAEEVRRIKKGKRRVVKLGEAKSDRVPGQTPEESPTVSAAVTVPVAGNSKPVSDAGTSGALMVKKNVLVTPLASGVTLVAKLPEFLVVDPAIQKQMSQLWENTTEQLNNMFEEKMHELNVAPKATLHEVHNEISEEVHVQNANGYTDDEVEEESQQSEHSGSGTEDGGEGDAVPKYRTLLKNLYDQSILRSTPKMSRARSFTATDVRPKEAAQPLKQLPAKPTRLRTQPNVESSNDGLSTVEEILGGSGEDSEVDEGSPVVRHAIRPQARSIARTVPTRRTRGSTAALAKDRRAILQAIQSWGVKFYGREKDDPEDFLARVEECME